MKIERLILIVFFGNYIINNLVAGLASLIPAGQARGILTAQYISFAVLSALVVGLLTWWYFLEVKKEKTILGGVYFGIGGFLVSLLTVFVSGISGVLIQTGSIAQVGQILPNFGPFIWNWSTVVLLAYWVLPSILVAWYLGFKKK
jgi:hypothetical protein